MSCDTIKRRAAPFSMRLTPEERARLERASGEQAISAHIKRLLFPDVEQPRRARTRSPLKDKSALAEVLACLGASRIANNLNQLAKHANEGNFYFDRETKAAIYSACEDIRAMRQLLMTALGMKRGAEPPARDSTSQGFARASARKRFEL
ncbi:MAG TPA: plasmid mobilization relaxosome protein MobC [Allosphingosinicella sp.]|nr:plasmid mobilization relaxosome protein MobC [Allosphingosinicella sp.]